MWEEKTPLNSSKVIVPEPSLVQTSAIRPGAECVDARIHVEILKGHIIVRVWAFEQGLEVYKVIPRQKAALRSVRDAKEDGELRAADPRQVAFWRNRVHKLVTIKESAAAPHRDHVHMFSEVSETSRRPRGRTFHR